MLVLSPFKLSVFRQCRRRFKFHYVDGLARQYARPRPYLTMGENVHAALRHLMALTKAESRTPEAVERLLRQKWATNREGFANRQEEKTYWERAVAQLRFFIESQEAAGRPFMLEAFHKAPVGDGISLQGKIDRVDIDSENRLHIIDYKTGKTPREIDTAQLLIYALVMSSVPRLDCGPVESVSYLYLNGTGKITFLPTGDDLASTRQQVLEQARAIAAAEGDYAPTPGRHCAWCDFLPLCPEGKEMIGEPAEEEPEDLP